MTRACPTPLPPERLHDYFAGELGPEQAERLEEHAFDCGACGEAFERAGALALGLRGLIPPVITHAKLDSLRGAGLEIRVTPIEPGVPVTVHFSPGLALLVHALRADIAGAERVDFELFDRAGRSLVELPGVPVDRESGEVLIACQRHYERDFSEAERFRIWTVIGATRRTAGDYVVAHVWR